MDFRPVAAVLAVLTVVFAGAAGYFATNPTTVVSTQVVTSAQPATTVTSTATQVNTVTNIVTSTGAPATPSYTIKLVYKAGVGFYMTNSSGWTLYLRKGDNGTGASTCTGGCITTWPAFYASSLTLPPGFDQNDFKVVPRTDGVKQLAYYGWPLYYYVRDKAVGDTVGQGAGSVWFVCCQLAAATTTSSTTSTTTNPTPAVKVAIASGAAGNQASPGYTQATMTLVRGVNASVAWTNNDSTAHTVTSVSVPSGAQSFASGNMNAGASFTVSFTVAGTYTYHCDYHSWMMGTIIVK